MALVGKCVAAGVAQHVRMHLEVEPGRRAGALHHAGKARGGEWRAALRREHERRRWLLLALEPAQGAQLAPGERVSAALPPSCSADVQVGRGRSRLGSIAGRPVLTPAGRAGRRSGSWWRRGGRCGWPWRPRSAGRPRHRCDTLACAARHLAGAQWKTKLGGCPIYSGWRHQRQLRICHDCFQAFLVLLSL